MSKAEKFIQDYTRNCSNEIWSPYPQINNDVRKIDGEPSKEFSPWLTPDQARRAVEIARGEMVDKLRKWIASKNERDSFTFGYIDRHFDELLKQAMKDECI